MARQGKGLTARKVETAKPGKYEDGHGLRLVVLRERRSEMGVPLYAGAQEG